MRSALRSYTDDVAGVVACQAAPFSETCVRTVSEPEGSTISASAGERKESVSFTASAVCTECHVHAPVACEHKRRLIAGPKLANERIADDAGKLKVKETGDTPCTR